MAAEWINKRRAQLERAQQEAKSKAVLDRLAMRAIGTDGPLFVESLLPEFRKQCADMDDIGFQAQAYSLDNPYCPEQKTYRIDVQTKGHFVHSAFALLVHTIGSSTINVTGSIPKLTEISLSVTERGIKAISNKDMRQMDVEELAGYLLEGLVAAIEKARKA